MNVERRNRSWPGFLLGAFTVLAVGVMWLNLTAPPPAFGQLGDAAGQRNEMVKELRGVNQRLSEIAGILKEIRDDARRDGDAEGAKSPKPKRP